MKKFIANSECHKNNVIFLKESRWWLKGNIGVSAGNFPPEMWKIQKNIGMIGFQTNWNPFDTFQGIGSFRKAPQKKPRNVRDFSALLSKKAPVCKKLNFWGKGPSGDHRMNPAFFGVVILQDSNTAFLVVTFSVEIQISDSLVF